MSLFLAPTTLDEANAFVAEHHRHHQPAQGHKFSIAVAEASVIRGVVICGRPVSQHMDNGFTLEVTRCCTDGARNACSMLYGAAWRAAKALGYKRLITYTPNSESGSSLGGAGWKLIGERGGGTWNRKDRPRIDKHPTQGKLLWSVGEVA